MGLDPEIAVVELFELVAMLKKRIEALEAVLTPAQRAKLEKAKQRKAA